MKRKRYTEEQIITILKEHEAGMPANDVIRKHGIANGTFIAGSRSSAAWRSQTPSGCVNWKLRMRS